VYKGQKRPLVGTLTHLWSTNKTVPGCFDKVEEGAQVEENIIPIPILLEIDNCIGHFSTYVICVMFSTPFSSKYKSQTPLHPAKFKPHTLIILSFIILSLSIHLFLLTTHFQDKGDITHFTKRRLFYKTGLDFLLVTAVSTTSASSSKML
jgi:hypothetical protein